MDTLPGGHSPPRFTPTPLAKVFAEADHQFRMRFTRGEARDFFAPTRDNASLIAQRKHWLRTAPETYAALLPEGEPLLAEAAQLAGSWQGFDNRSANSQLQNCLALGEFWEPDFLLLRADGAGEVLLFGGCLCFASNWSLGDKIGRPLELIHGPVPGLNAALGPAIHRFLVSLKPGLAWQRVNWGLSRSPELNQHPHRPLPRLDADVPASEVWLRVEEQAVVGLPDGVLFGIRVVNHALDDVARDPAVAANVSHALEAMPEELARYKGLHTARRRLIALLQPSDKSEL